MFQREVAEGIFMRLLHPDDAEAIFRVVERQRAYLREWLPWVDRTHSAEDVRRFITDVVLPQEAGGRGPNCGIWVDGALAGSAGCHPIDWQNRSASVGYWLDAGYQGRGIITRSTAALIDYLFDEMALHRAVIQCGVANRRSCAIPARLGFTKEGLLREAEWVNDRWVDLLVWGMLAEEWRRSDRLLARPPARGPGAGGGR